MIIFKNKLKKLNSKDKLSVETIEVNRKKSAFVNSLA